MFKKSIPNYLTKIFNDNNAVDISNDILECILQQDKKLNFTRSRIRIKENSVKLIINQKSMSSDLEAKCFSELKKKFPNYNFFAIYETDEPESQVIKNKSIPHAPKGSIRPQSMKKILIVASGKGGVGKSVVSVNMARAFHSQGFKVALIDCDIYGPSSPVMTGGYEKVVYNNSKLQPIMRDGIKMMSIGFMVDSSKPIIWRGPMVSGAIAQMFQETQWGDIDIAVVDMPPGTGDAQLTICQNLSPDGVVIVSQPQLISVIDVERCAMMFEQLKIPIWGIVENMCGFIAPDTGKTYYIFGQGGAESFAESKNYEFLGSLPIVPTIAYVSDQGLNPLLYSECVTFTKPLLEITEHLIKMHLKLPVTKNVFIK
jgi:Mrp family chromosome partitioning ATPase